MRGGNGSLPWFPIYFDALLDSYLIKRGGEGEWIQSWDKKMKGEVGR